MMAAPSDATARLIRVAAQGSVTLVEAALGRVPRNAVLQAARQAATSALAAERWENLAYLADFLADVTATHLGAGEDASEGIVGFVVPRVNAMRERGT
jgi:hypothetical protein